MVFLGVFSIFFGVFGGFLGETFWWIFLVDVFVTNPRLVVFADFLVDFFVRYILGVWFLRFFSWQMVLQIFLVYVGIF